MLIIDLPSSHYLHFRHQTTSSSSSILFVPDVLNSSLPFFTTRRHHISLSPWTSLTSDRVPSTSSVTFPLCAHFPRHRTSQPHVYLFPSSGWKARRPPWHYGWGAYFATVIWGRQGPPRGVKVLQGAWVQGARNIGGRIWVTSSSLFHLYAFIRIAYVYYYPIMFLFSLVCFAVSKS